MTKLNSHSKLSYTFNFDRTPDIRSADNRILGEYGFVGMRLIIPDYRPSDTLSDTLSAMPSGTPSAIPSAIPSAVPSGIPSDIPSDNMTYASHGKCPSAAGAFPYAGPIISDAGYAADQDLDMSIDRAIHNPVRMPQAQLYHPDTMGRNTKVCSETHDYSLSEDIEFELFKNQLFKTLPEYLPPRTGLGIQQYCKENGKILHGLTFTPPKHNGSHPDIVTSPVIYIDSFFKEYLNFELGIKEICMLIAREYDENTELPFKFDVNELTDYKKASKRLIIKLLNREKSAELLKTTPHIDHADLSLIASYVLPGSLKNEYTCTVSDRLMQIWGIEKEELFLDAAVSSEQMQPLKIRSMIDFMNELNLGVPVSALNEAPELFILTNSGCNGGASSIFYKGAAEKCLEIVGGDYYILPSSVHELLLISKSKSPDPDSLRDTVEHVNSLCVKDTEYLSGNVYSFNFNTRTLDIV